MDSTRIIELISYTLPTIIMAFVAYSFFELYTKNENAKRNYLLKKESKPDTLSLRLQAYERMTLFLERINPSQLLVRITPISDDKNDYQNYVIAQIEHIDGITNIKEIIATEGIDAVFIGPYDLSASLGIPGQYNDPSVLKALEEFEIVCKEEKKTMGYHVIEPDSSLVTAKHEAGFNFIAFSTDFLFMAKKAEQEMKKIAK